MNIKQNLKRFQKLVPSTWLYHAQNIHSILLFQWMIGGGSELLTCSQKPAMVFSPHQDDETFGCGGMIALKREQGIPVVVVFLTDGQGCGSSDLSKDEIIKLREQEALRALEILGVESANIHFLAKPDGTLQDLPNEQRQQTIEQLTELIKFYKPEEVYVPHHKDSHRDHEATYELVKAAIADEKMLHVYAQTGIEVELLQYPIWLFWRAPLFLILKFQDMAAAYRISIKSVQVKKNQAITSYRSQLESLPYGFVKRFLSSYEIFFKA